MQGGHRILRGASGTPRSEQKQSGAVGRTRSLAQNSADSLIRRAVSLSPAPTSAQERRGGLLRANLRTYLLASLLVELLRVEQLAHVAAVCANVHARAQPHGY
jgi:hypothetical protein